VTRFQPGDEVFGWCGGSFAEYAIASEDQLAAKPANLSFEQAAAVPISGFAALQALRNMGEVQAGQKVLVIGTAGAVGSFAVQLAKAFGTQVTGVASTSQLEQVRSIGADQVIDYTRADVTDGTRKWDLIIDTAGRRSLSQLRRALTPNGTLVIVGGEGGGRLMGGFLSNLRAPVLSQFVGQRQGHPPGRRGRAGADLCREPSGAVPAHQPALGPAHAEPPGAGGHGLLQRPGPGSDRLRRPPGGAVLLRRPGLQPVQAGQRALHLRAGPAAAGQLGDRQYAGPVAAAVHADLRRSSKASYDKATAARLWRVSAELVGLTTAG